MSSSQSGDLITLFQTLSRQRRHQLLAVALLMPVTAVAEMAMVAAIVPLLSALDSAANPNSVLEGALGWLDHLLPATSITAAAFLFILTVITASVLRLALSWASLRFSADLGHDLNIEIQRRMLHQPYLFHTSSHSSRLLASLEKVDELVLGFALRGLQFFSALIMSVGLIIALLLVDATSALIALALVAGLYGAALLVVRARYRRLSDFLPSAHQQRIQLAQDNLGGIRDIILDRSQDAHLEQFRKIDWSFMRARTDVSFLSTAPRYLVEGVGLSLLALVAVGVAGNPGGLPAALPTIGALGLGALRLMPLASQLYGGWVVMASNRRTVSEVATLVSLPSGDQDFAPSPLPFSKRIEFEGVGFHYPGRGSAALRDISLSIPHGSRIAIVGRTGSGKSSLADLLMGLIEPTEGQIRVDGALIAGPALAAWRKSVAHVPQAIFLADASIARNIALGISSGEVDMGRVERVAAIAQLDGFIATLPQGYETKVGERGVRLSGGQRQRLALARAIYRQPRLLVLDEATSALDDETESAVLASLDQVQADGCTIVIVAHRLSTVERCDRIFVLDEGTLVRSGSSTELFGPLNRLREQGEL